MPLSTQQRATGSHIKTFDHVYKCTVCYCQYFHFKKQISTAGCFLESLIFIL